MLRDAGEPKCSTGGSYFHAKTSSRPTSRKIVISSLLHYLECVYRNALKGIENCAIILVPLIMILSRGHTGQIKG